MEMSALRTRKKEIRLSLFADDMSDYIELKNLIFRILLEFSKVVKFKLLKYRKYYSISQVTWWTLGGSFYFFHYIFNLH